MKNYLKFRLSIIGLFAFTFLTSLQAQDSKITTVEFETKGVCTMCEKRIEKAALISGVISADWNRENHMLKVIYRPKKVTLTAIKEAVSSSGHDTDEVKATDEVYGQLPACCKYRDGIKSH